MAPCAAFHPDLPADDAGWMTALRAYGSRIGENAFLRSVGSAAAVSRRIFTDTAKRPESSSLKHTTTAFPGMAYY